MSLADTTAATSSRQPDAGSPAPRRHGPWWFPWAVALGVTVLATGLAFALPDYWLLIATSVLVAMMSLLGLGIVTGTAGMIALCQLSFAAVGGWVMDLLMTQTALPELLGGAAFVVAMLVGATAASLLGLIVGLPALRLRGVNLAVVTLGVAAALDMTLQKVSFPDQWTNERVQRPFGIPGAEDLSGNRSYFLFVAGVVIIVALGVFYLQRSRWGAGWRMVAFSERGTASTGTSVTSAKLSAFMVSAFIGGIAGSLMVGQITTANYITFQTLNSLGLYVLSMAVGAHLIEMAFFGGILFVLIPEILKQFNIPLEWASIIYAVLGIQALTTKSSMGNDLRRMILAWQRKRGLNSIESTLVSLEPVGAPVPAASDNVLLEVKDLRVEFGAVVALSDVTMQLHEGEILGLIGPNGAGKSTFVDSLTGFLPHHTGSVTLDGVELDSLAPHKIARAGLRRTFQQDRVPSTMTVGAYARFVGGKEVDEDLIDEVLAFFGCPGTQAPLQMVDVGTRRLIEVAANIAAGPKLLLLDEPAAGLSHEEHVAFADRLRAVPERFGVSLLIIEHDLDLVRSVCSNLVVLNFGQVLATGRQEDVLANPEVLKAYMGETEMVS
ncbi:branched-chain amino acid ABC transporter ATP-binding protein/permease [Demequina zhanjiangensis]|uniref:ATP-binding cassette domain-containing protein n=1 Tax=Demequina zhanjiangensis TaxID=3051659 RepID=A0ABT8G4D4_9MICO|nr:ATP-binding cassette domain-containing protein [Demequina sp. SYSU T00b26]MDN4474005.1 ATP-binding cassette domain-containing protein [Demequina sp. SYSU T00b26]